MAGISPRHQNPAGGNQEGDLQHLGHIRSSMTATSLPYKPLIAFYMENMRYTALRSSNYGPPSYEPLGYGPSNYNPSNYGSSSCGPSNYGPSNYGPPSYVPASYESLCYGPSNYNPSNYGSSSCGPSNYDLSNYAALRTMANRTIRCLLYTSPSPRD